MIIQHARIGGEEKTLVLENGKICEITAKDMPGDIDAAGKWVIPGLIDVHTHGGAGYDTMDADLEPLCHFYASHGTTSFLPTTMTMSYEDIRRVTDSKTDFAGAHILGFHLEGPFISEKYKGAQNSAFIRQPSVEAMQQFQNVKMITIAPELPGSETFIRAVSGEMIVSIGHSDCDYETALRAIDCGASCLTHTYNAMPPFHHRRPGPIGAGYDRHIYAQVIGDGFHVSPSVLKATYAMFGAERMVLISDSIRPAGLPDGTYSCGGLQVILRDGVARLPDGTIAGSGATLWDCVKTAVDCGIDFDEAVRMATRTPAEMLGVKKGNIAEGYDADLLIIDDQMNIQTVIIDGKVYDKR